MAFNVQSPYQHYLNDLAKQSRIEDKDQRIVIAQLQLLYEQLSAQKKMSWWGKILSAPAEIKGIYLWGGVGRGKTYLMDLFFHSLPFDEKVRLHFHRFMHQIHQALRNFQGEKNPLQKIARQWASNIRVLCFDEFYVSDIADAMILAELLKELFAQRVVLVATSNVQPKDLYRSGLQRDRFLPAIDLLYQHTQVVQIGGSTDFRLRTLERSQLYYSPLSKEAEAALLTDFQALNQGNPVERGGFIKILDRDIAIRYMSDGILWCDFMQLCGAQRSQNDYIELSRYYHTVIISQIPMLKVDHEDQARRFIHLVDEFYDRGVKLIISSEVEIPFLYEGQRLKFEFQRTESRLLEMQSENYLAKPHQP